MNGNCEPQEYRTKRVRTGLPRKSSASSIGALAAEPPTVAVERMTGGSGLKAMVAISARMARTDVPCIVSMQQMLRGKKDVLSLAQGIVHWAPPDAALAAGRAAMGEPDTSLYGPDDGLPALREKLKEKLRLQNGIENSDVMVTAGANQGYTNVVLSLMDAGDAALLFRPYYFNHLMALQMTGSAESIVLPDSLPDLQPNVPALQAELEGRARCDAPPPPPPLRLPSLRPPCLPDRHGR